MKREYWSSSSGRIVIELEHSDACEGSHSGACDDDIAYLRTVPYIKEQLNKLQPDDLRCELRGFGAWDSDELADHDANLSRILWLACADIKEGNV